MTDTGREGGYSGVTCRGCYALGTACGRCERCAQERLRMSLNDMRIAEEITPEVRALTEVMQIVAPAVKLPAATLASRIDLMLRKRGFCVSPAPQGEGT